MLRGLNHTPPLFLHMIRVIDQGRLQVSELFPNGRSRKGFPCSLQEYKPQLKPGSHPLPHFSVQSGEGLLLRKPWMEAPAVVQIRAQQGEKGQASTGPETVGKGLSCFLCPPLVRLRGSPGHICPSPMIHRAEEPRDRKMITAQGPSPQSRPCRDCCAQAVHEI